MVFYRTYRPLTLETLDNPQVAETLRRFLAQKSIPHAFLFTGPKGTGKTSCARIVAKSINCQVKPGIACGSCEICRSIANGTALDVMELDAASNRGIDEIRALKEGIKLSPLSLQYKVYIIDEVHMLTTEAFNALLKTLEEPPSHAVFILATTEAHKIPETISSRCITIPFTTGGIPGVVSSLKRIATGEKLDITPELLQTIAELSEGSFRDAAKLLEEVSLMGKKITLEHITLSIGGSDKKKLDLFLSLLKEKKTEELLILLQELAKADVTIRLFLKDILSSLERKLIDSFDTTKSSWTTPEVIRALTLFSRYWTDYKTPLVPTIPLELAIVDYCTDSPVAQSFKPQTMENQPTSNVQSFPADKSADAISNKWEDILTALKSHNHSLVGVLRSCKPLLFKDTVVTIESPYKFHTERLSEVKTRELIAKVISSVIGSEVHIQIVSKN